MNKGPVRRSERGLERITSKEIAIVCPGGVLRDKVALEWKLVGVQYSEPEEGLKTFNLKSFYVNDILICNLCGIP